MEMILAQKGKLKREFTRASWDRLGKEKSGWTPLPPEAQKRKPGKDVIIPETTPQAKTVAELRAELDAAIAAEEAAENNKPGTDQEVGNEYKGPYSTDEGTSWQSAVKIIKTLKTAEDINNYVAKGDDRKTVQGAKALRLQEIKL